MNDERYPFHAISFYDCFGGVPFLSSLPREEDDFPSQADAEEWLRQRGGGTIDKSIGDSWKLVATILPEGEGDRVLSA